MSELGAGWQTAMDQEPGCLCEPGVLGKLLDGDAAIAQNSFLTVDEGDLAYAGSGVAVPRVERNQAGTGAQLGNIEGQLTFGTLDDRQFDPSAIERQCRVPCHHLGLPSGPVVPRVK